MENQGKPEKHLLQNMALLVLPYVLQTPKECGILILLWGCGEMADAHALGACAARRVGSNPTIPTTILLLVSLSSAFSFPISLR